MNNTLNPLVRTVLCKPIKAFSNSKLGRYTGEQFKKNNRMFIDGLGVSSIIAKDGLGCYLYVTQSMNNKDIPDDKRKFVAALDLTNGVLMIALQLLMFFTVSHKVCQTAMFDKAFGKMFDRPLRKCTKLMQEVQRDFPILQVLNLTKTSIQSEIVLRMLLVA